MPQPHKRHLFINRSPTSPTARREQSNSAAARRAQIPSPLRFQAYPDPEAPRPLDPLTPTPFPGSPNLLRPPLPPLHPTPGFRRGIYRTLYSVVNPDGTTNPLETLQDFQSIRSFVGETGHSQQAPKIHKLHVEPAQSAFHTSEKCDELASHLSESDLLAPVEDHLTTNPVSPSPDEAFNGRNNVARRRASHESHKTSYGQTDASLEHSLLDTRRNSSKQSRADAENESAEEAGRKGSDDSGYYADTED